MKKTFKQATTAYVVNYAAFKLILGNRTVTDEEHVVNIEAALRKKEFVPPIIVDENTGYIIDGQHRYMAACNLWRKGIECELTFISHNFGDPLQAAIRYNSTSKKWSVDDYVTAYIQAGNESYSVLKKFCQTHELLHSLSIFTKDIKLHYTLAYHFLTKKSSSNAIIKGTLSIGDLAKAEELYGQFEQIYNAVGNTRFLSKGAILGWEEVRDYVLPKCGIKKFCTAMKNSFQLPESNSKTAYVAEFIRVANKVK